MSTGCSRSVHMRWCIAVLLSAVVASVDGYVQDCHTLLIQISSSCSQRMSGKASIRLKYSFFPGSRSRERHGLCQRTYFQTRPYTDQDARDSSTNATLHADDHVAVR
jgi:hypothetical protein